MPPGIGYGPGLPSLDELFSALAADGQAPAAPPSPDLLLPPELNPIEPGPLHDVADGLGALGQVGRALVPPGVALPGTPPAEPVLDPYTVPPPAPANPPLRAPRGSEAAIQEAEGAELALGSLATGGQVAATRDEAAALGQAADGRLRVEQERERTLFGDKSNAPGANEGVVRAGQKRVEAEVAKLQRLQEQAYSTKINEKAHWESRTDAQKVISAVSVFLGGLLIPTTGRNPAMEIIDRAVQRNIQAQEANLANLGESVGRQRSLLAEVRQQVGDREAAVNLASAISLRQIELDLEGKIAGIGDQKAQARGLDLLRQLEGRRAEYERMAYERASDAAWKEFQAELAMMRASTKGTGEAKPLAEPGAIDPLRVTGVEPAEQPGLGYVQFPDSVAGREAAGRMRDLIKSNRSMANVQASMEDLGTAAKLPSDAKKRIGKALMAELQVALQAHIKGIPSDKDAVLLRDQLGGIQDPGKIFDWLSASDRMEVLRAIRDRTLQAADEELTTYGRGARLVPYTGTSLFGKATTKQPLAPGKLSRNSLDPEAFAQDLSKADDLGEVQAVQRNHAQALAQLHEQLQQPLLSPKKEAELEAQLKALKKVGGEIAKKLRQGEKAAAQGNEFGRTSVGEDIERAEKSWLGPAIRPLLKKRATELAE